MIPDNKIDSSFVRRAGCLRTLVATTLLIVAGASLAAQQSHAPVDGAALLRTVSELADERFAGRLTGTGGNAAAARWLAGRLADAGARPLPGTDAGPAPVDALTLRYRQPILDAGSPARLVATGLDGAAYELAAGPSFDVAVRDGTRISGARSGPLRTLTASRATPAWIRANRESVLLVEAEEFPALTRSRETAEALFHPTRSPQAVLIVLPERVEAIPRGLFLTGRNYAASGPMLAQITAAAAAALEPDTGMRVELAADFAVREAEVVSVAGRFGSGEAPPIVLSAHLDGPGRIEGVGHYPGAADNASGCAVVLEAARRLASARLTRPVWVVFFNGEEQGLYGSRAFAERYADELRGAQVINVDMVGHSVSTGFVVSRADGSAALAARVRDALAAAGRQATVTESGLSDHASFGGTTPAVSIVQAPYPNMHLPSDRPEALQAPVLAAVTEALLAVVEELAAAPLTGARE